ncbi:MAG: glycosyl hydrolase family 28-related protein, partial [Thiobacillus sp.]
MTVQTSTNVASFNGDGANKVFPIGYKFNSAADLVVTLIDDDAKTTKILTLNSDFTVTGAGDEKGGAVTLAVAPTVVQRLKVTRVVDILQLTDLRNQGKAYAEIHEDAFDLLTMIAQQHQSDIASSLRVAETDPDPARIPSVAQRAGKLLAFDAAGNPTTALPVADSSTELRQALADPSGAGKIGYSQRTVADRLSDTVSAKDFGAKADGVTDDSAAIQAAIDYCAQNSKCLFIPAGIYYVPTPINLLKAANANSYEIVGAGCGDAYWEPAASAGMAGTVIKTAGNDVFTIPETAYPNSSVNISKIRVLGDSSLKTGFLLNIGNVTRQLKNMWLTEITASYCGGILKAAAVNATNLAYLTMTRCYTWSTDKVVLLDNVPTTIWTIRDSLFHGTKNSALDIGLGAELSISDTWFEGCEPAAISKPGTNFLKLAMHNVYFESSTADTSMVFGTNTDITLSGKTNLPGSFMADKPFVLGSLCSLANYTSEAVTIRSMGGVVKTPDTVRLHTGFSHQVHIPMQNAGYPLSFGDDLFSNSIAGEVCTVNEGSPIPAEISRILAPALTGEMVKGTFSSSPTYTDNRLVCAAFAYASASVDNGMLSGSSITIDGTAVSL